MQLCEQIEEKQRPRTRGQQLSKTPSKNQLPLDAVLAFIESSGKLVMMEQGHLWQKHPDLEPCNRAKKNNFIHGELNLFIIRSEELFFLRDFKQKSGCYRDIRGRRALAACDMCRVSKHEEHKRKAKSVGPKPVRDTLRVLLYGALNVPCIHVEGALPLNHY